MYFYQVNKKKLPGLKELGLSELGSRKSQEQKNHYKASGLSKKPQNLPSSNNISVLIFSLKKRIESLEKQVKNLKKQTITSQEWLFYKTLIYKQQCYLGQLHTCLFTNPIKKQNNNILNYPYLSNFQNQIIQTPKSKSFK